MKGVFSPEKHQTQPCNLKDRQPQAHSYMGTHGALMSPPFHCALPVSMLFAADSRLLLPLLAYICNCGGLLMPYHSIMHISCHFLLLIQLYENHVTGHFHSVLRVNMVPHVSSHMSGIISRTNDKFERSMLGHCLSHMICHLITVTKSTGQKQRNQVRFMQAHSSMESQFVMKRDQRDQYGQWQ